MLVVHEYVINEQLYQLPALGEVKMLQGWLETFTKCFNVARQLPDGDLLLGLGLQLAQLLRQALLRLIQFLVFAFELTAVDHLGQIDGQQTLLLARQLPQRPLHCLASGLQRLRQPFATLGTL
jgi:hypothetical protein